LLVIIAILLLPVAACLAQNGIKKYFWISIIRCRFSGFRALWGGCPDFVLCSHRPACNKKGDENRIEGK